MDELVTVAVGKSFTVYMTRAVAKRFEKVDVKARARCLQWMKRFADDGHEFLDETKLKHEGRHSTGDKSGTKVAVWAFKAWQLRIYGGLVGEKTFICTEIDDSKKRDAADQSLFGAAARKLSDYLK
ncbi:hypothetical protein [Rhizobium subbaraonis]|nr:hypothetical protein [Rhizobium subbaraonis]